MIELDITGTEQLHDLGKKLKDLGDRDLQKDLIKRIREGTAPMRQAAKDAALAELPHKGGLNQFVAASKATVRTKTIGRSVGVRVTMNKKGHDLASIDRGRLRHPVFARADRKRVWVNQQITPQVITHAFEHSTPQVRQEIARIVDDVTRRLA